MLYQRSENLDQVRHSMIEAERRERQAIIPVSKGSFKKNSIEQYDLIRKADQCAAESTRRSTLPPQNIAFDLYHHEGRCRDQVNKDKEYRLIRASNLSNCNMSVQMKEVCMQQGSNGTI